MEQKYTITVIGLNLKSFSRHLIYKISYSFTLILICLNATFAQEQIKEAERAVYSLQNEYGIYSYTNGYGALWRASRKITAFKYRSYGIDAQVVKHSKEEKSFNGYEDTKGYIYGKLNSFIVFRPFYGIQKVRFTKEFKKGVQISTNLSFGPSIGFLKPVYLEIAYDNIASPTSRKFEKFNPLRHNVNNIYAGSPFIRGIDETTIVPGLNFRYSANFEYSPQDHKIKALEVGLIVEAYSKKVPIMAFANNSQFFLSMYAGINIGKKK